MNTREDRVRTNTDAEINRRSDTQLERRIRYFATQDKQAVSERIEELDAEWDIERVLEANAASLGLLGLVLSITSSRKWLVLPLAVSGFLLQHAIQGWCPPAHVLRRWGVRTRFEIEQERYALKMLRGDFEKVGPLEAEAPLDAGQLMAGVRA
jgi:hypothetical protein